MNYQKIGHMGGIVRSERTKLRGFASHPEMATVYGRKGGKNSSRAGIKNIPKLPWYHNLTDAEMIAVWKRYDSK